MTDIDEIDFRIIVLSFSGYFYGNDKKLIVNSNYVPFGSFFGPVVFSGLTVTGYVFNGGGILVNIQDMCTVLNCTNNVTVISLGVAGGVVYENYNSTVINCINNGVITATDRLGGIAGTNEGHIINCINTGKITATGSGGSI